MKIFFRFRFYREWGKEIQDASKNKQQKQNHQTFPWKLIRILCFSCAWYKT